jgi:hypothetical protein
MSNTDNPANDEEQLATIPTDYRALLAMTRPLLIAEHTLRSWRGGEICRSGFGIPLEPGDWPAEFTLSRGEIVRPDESELRTTGDEGRATGNEEAGTSSAQEVGDESTEARCALPRGDSNLQIRICLGMS